MYNDKSENMELKILKYGNIQQNSFYDPNKSSNGGGYDQPYEKMLFLQNNDLYLFNYDNTSCGDFGLRKDITLSKLEANGLTGIELFNKLEFIEKTDGFGGVSFDIKDNGLSIKNELVAHYEIDTMDTNYLEVGDFNRLDEKLQEFLVENTNLRKQELGGYYAFDNDYDQDYENDESVNTLNEIVNEKTGARLSEKVEYIDYGYGDAGIDIYYNEFTSGNGYKVEITAKCPNGVLFTDDENINLVNILPTYDIFVSDTDRSHFLIVSKVDLDISVSNELDMDSVLENITELKCITSDVMSNMYNQMKEHLLSNEFNSLEDVLTQAFKIDDNLKSSLSDLGNKVNEELTQEYSSDTITVETNNFRNLVLTRASYEDSGISYNELNSIKQKAVEDSLFSNKHNVDVNYIEAKTGIEEESISFAINNKNDIKCTLFEDYMMFENDEKTYLSMTNDKVDFEFFNRYDDNDSTFAIYKNNEENLVTNYNDVSFDFMKEKLSSYTNTINTIINDICSDSVKSVFKDRVEIASKTAVDVVNEYENKEIYQRKDVNLDI